MVAILRLEAPNSFVQNRIAQIPAQNYPKASRLQNSLVKTAGVATTASVSVEASAGPNLFIVQVLVAPGKDPAQAERMVYEEIDRVAREGAPKDEVERVETDYLRKRTFSLVTTAARALVFDEFLTIYRRLDAVNDWERQVRRIGSDDLKRVARKYLTPGNRTVMVVTPAGKP